MKKQKENSLENITWSEMGKQNVQAKEVYLSTPRGILMMFNQQSKTLTFIPYEYRLRLPYFAIKTIQMPSLGYKEKFSMYFFP